MGERKAPPRPSKPPLRVSTSVDDSSLQSYASSKHFYEPVTLKRNTSPQHESLQTVRKDRPTPLLPYVSLQKSNSLDASAHGLRHKLSPSKQLRSPASGRKSPLANEDSLQNFASPWTSSAPGRPKWHKNYKELVQLSSNACLNLKELLRDHSRSFPLKVKVVKGDEKSIQNGDVFNIHFVKKTEVVTVVDMTGKKYTVPFNSAAKFAIVYSPPRMYNESTVFETARDVIYAAEQPKVVMATRKINGDDGKAVLIEKNELLIPQKAKASKFGLTQKLSVFSFTDQCVKMIPHKAFGHFTTDPFKCQLYLPDLVNCIPDLFPIKARIFFNLELENPLPDALKREVITLQGQSTITTLVASHYRNKQSLKPVEQVLKPVELSVELDIKVVLVNSSSEHLENNEEHLYEDTVALIQGYKSSTQGAHSHISFDYVVPEISPRSVTQTFLLNRVRSGHEYAGVSIEQPALIAQPKELQKLQHSTGDKDGQTGLEAESEYQPLIFDGSRMSGNEYQPLSPKKTPNSDQLYAIIDDVTPLRSPSSAQATNSFKFEHKSDTTKPPPLPVKPCPQSYLSPPINNIPPPISPRTRHRDQKVMLINSPQATPTFSPPASPTPSPPVTPTQATPLHTPTVRPTPSLSQSPQKLQNFETTETKSSTSTYDETRSPNSTDAGPVDAVTDAQNRMVCININNEETKTELETLTTRCRKLEEDVQKLQKEMKQVLQKVELQGEQKLVATTTNSASNEPDMDEREANLSRLRSLNESQVVQLLEAMNLSQYTERFQDQHIDGGILSECNDDVLQVELRITSKIHRLRLMRYISGMGSVLTMLSTDHAHAVTRLEI